jgi:3'-phosphoadenosine 5'-phosphosulfate sulfotransferase (PAPS reductase)/FAD synthetase
MPLNLKSIPMKYIVTFSGGKDSEATVIWAKNNLSDFEVVFCDTGWESIKTYDHIRALEQWLGKSIIILKSTKYKDFFDLCMQKKRIASVKGRFCTEELKMKPMIDYVLSLKEDVTILQGVRHEESMARRNLLKQDEYFKFYLEPYGHTKKGASKFHTYRKREVLEHINSFSADVLRPIITWTANEVFQYISSNGRKANPHYYEGFSRVGCFPCIMCKLSEIRLIAQQYPERIEQIRKLERAVGASFFGPGYIPERFCSNKVINKKGEISCYPTIDDVVNYVLTRPKLEIISTTPGCVSVYNICEAA